MERFITSTKSTLPLFPAVLFFFSGFCGLLYQLVWIRLAFAAFGINTPVLSVVLSVFMAGLALGSWWGGRLTAQWPAGSGRVPLRFYALAECLIGLGGLSVPFLFSRGSALLLPLGAADSTQYLFWSAVVLALSLLPWCLCMGATFPFMMSYLQKTSRTPDSFSFLYTANVFGAMTGTLVTAGILIECLGFRGTLEAASALNFAVAISSLGMREARNPAAPSPVPAPLPSPKSSSLSPLLLLFTTGFMTMAMEVLWTRDFSIILKTQVYSFAALIFAYLLSTLAGSWMYRRHEKRGGLSTAWLAGAAFLFSLGSVLFDDPRINHSIPGVLLSIVPFCAALGYLTPKLLDQFSSGDPRKAGRAYGLNVLGCILGPLAAAYLLLPLLGVRTSLILLSIPLLPFFLKEALVSWQWRASRLIPAALGLSLLAASLFWAVDYEEGFSLSRSAVIRRDYAATVISLGGGMDKYLFVNGIGITRLCQATKDMAHLPLALLPRKPKSVLGICFGMGTTFRALMSWGTETTHVELAPGVLKAFDYYFPDADRLRSLSRAHLVADDGRRFLERTADRYDLITVDPPPPLEAAGSSLLYSVEFYDLVKKHLSPGGLFQQWIPNGDPGTWTAAANSLHLSFPYIRVFASPERLGDHFIASLTPILPLTPKEMAAKLPAEAKADFMEWSPGESPERYFQNLLSQELPLSGFIDPKMTRPITDDRPYNEYYLLRRFRAWLKKSAV